MKRIMNKKAMFFSIIAIALLSLFVLGYSSYTLLKDRRPVSDRIETLNNFVFSLEEDLPRQLYISGFRIIFLMDKRIVEKGDYIDDVNNRANELFFSGTLYNQTNEDIETLMRVSTFSGMQESLNNKARKLNIEINLTSPFFNISQEDPWSIKFSLTADLLVRDIGGLALWNKSAEIAAYVPISGFEDPLYIHNTNGTVTNKINQTAYSIPISSENLLSHVQNSYYIASSSAPDFLDRLEGKTSASENGIESLVYTPKLSAQGITIKQKSIVDYIYFSADNPSSCSVQGQPGWLILDNPHLATYGASCG